MSEQPSAGCGMRLLDVERAPPRQGGSIEYWRAQLDAYSAHICEVERRLLINESAAQCLLRDAQSVDADIQQIRIDHERLQQRMFDAQGEH